MKVYGNVDTKDVASFKLFAKNVGGVYMLHHDPECENPVSCDELKAMAFKAPIWAYDAEGNTTAAALVVVIEFGVNESDGKEYGVCGINDLDTYTKEYDGTVE